VRLFVCCDHVLPRLASASPLRFGLLGCTCSNFVAYANLEFIALKVAVAPKDAFGYDVPVVTGDTILCELFCVLVAFLRGDYYHIGIITLVHFLLGDLQGTSSLTYLLDFRERFVDCMSASGEMKDITFERGLWVSNHIFELEIPLFFLYASTDRK
jgi:hypothetical protein